jgi:hypothetical protein
VRTRLLDKVVRYRFGDNAELMGAWESARNVAGSFQTKNEPESGAGGSETLREALGRPPKAGVMDAAVPLAYGSAQTGPYLFLKGKSRRQRRGRAADWVRVVAI